MSTTIELPFSHEECIEAYEQWGANCGPAALAAILNLPLDRVRLAVEAAGFSKARNYLSPTMMENALQNLRVKWHTQEINAFSLGGLAFPNHGLARIQWEGPWTQPGANPRWAYRHTHWVASWKQTGSGLTTEQAVLSQLEPVLFDVNGGLVTFEQWETEIVPLITKSIPRADGDWSVTHSFEIDVD